MKTNVFQKIKTLVLASVLGVVALGSSNSFADSVNCYGVSFSGLPGLIAPSLPAFGTYVSASFTYGKTSSKLTVTQASTTSALFKINSPYIYGISSTSYTLTANFNGSGVFTSGNIVIKGKFNGSSTVTTLMTANLTKFAKSSDGYIWGFNTGNIICSAAVSTAAGGCTTTEVVYLGLASAQKVLTKSWTSKGVALTSVPVPAAAWLFGSGLIGLVGVARRNKVAA